MTIQNPKSEKDKFKVSGSFEFWYVILIFAV
jgi:hypothetical protein